jgi:hypothetical protein
MSQTNGKRMIAARARGQQKKARRQKSRKLSIRVPFLDRVTAGEGKKFHGGG